MEKTLIFVDTDTDISDFNIPQLESSQPTVFSFNVHTHKLLEEKGIQHEIGESYLNEEDHYKIFDKTVSCWEWFKNNPAFQELEFETVNLLSVLDTAELHQVIIRELYIFLTMKRIIEKTKPEKIITSDHFSSMLKPLVAKNNIKIEMILSTALEAVSYEYGHALCSYFYIYPKWKNLSDKTIAAFLSSNIAGRLTKPSTATWAPTGGTKTTSPGFNTMSLLLSPLISKS